MSGSVMHGVEPVQFATLGAFSRVWR